MRFASIVLAAAVAAAVAVGATPARVHAAPADHTAALLAELHDGAKCDDATSPWRLWCIAADGWAQGKPAPLPTNRVLVGVTVTLVDGGPAAVALRDHVSLSAFAIGKGKAPKVKVTSITPSNDDEALSIGKAVAEIALVLKGKAADGALPDDLAGYVKQLTGAATYATRKGKHGWTWTGASKGEARKVGDAWVVIEIASEGPPGIFVTILSEHVQ